MAKSNGDTSYRQYLPDLESQRFQLMKQCTAYQHAEAFKTSQQPPWFHALYTSWQDLAQEPYKGITTDGTIRPNLFQIRDESVPIQQIVDAAVAALSTLTESQYAKVRYHIDSPEWRTWSNPEFLLSDKGVRLDELSATQQTKFLDLLKCSLSPEGYEKAMGAMRINGFLGELVKSRPVLNEFSYNFSLFGREPSTDRPWGFSFYGHHLCLNLFFYKTQMILSPWFTGAEPNVIDDGLFSGTQILHQEEALGLQLMQSLSEKQKGTAQIYKELKDPSMPPGRWNPDDQRHLCGAYQDNRVVPYEGILVDSLSSTQQQLVTDILHQYLLYLPQPCRGVHLDHLKSWFHETYFTWIGGFDDHASFYFRIQNPVIIVEFDHHSGVFLTNKQPARFHIHTLLRTPNGGDYGYALRSLIPSANRAFVWDG